MLHEKKHSRTLPTYSLQYSSLTVITVGLLHLKNISLLKSCIVSTLYMNLTMYSALTDSSLNPIMTDPLIYTK